MTQHVRVQCVRAVCIAQAFQGRCKKLISAKAGAEELSYSPFRGRRWRVSGPYHQHGLVADVLAPHEIQEKYPLKERTKEE